VTEKYSFAISIGSLLDKEEWFGYFQQDFTTTHTARNSIHVL